MKQDKHNENKIPKKLKNTEHSPKIENQVKVIQLYCHLNSFNISNSLSLIFPARLSDNSIFLGVCLRRVCMIKIIFKNVEQNHERVAHQQR